LTPNRGSGCPPAQRRVGVIFQNYALFPHLTVAQNIAFGIPAGLSEAEKQERIQAQLRLVKLKGWENRYPHRALWRTAAAGGPGASVGF
jgi:molybdate transport system ATP-binding protein